MNGRSDAQATWHLEGLRVREGGMVSTRSVLEANDSQQDLVVSHSKRGKVFRSEGPRHTSVEQGLNHLSLQQSYLKAKGSGRPIIQLRAEPFEACSHEADPWVYFEPEVSGFVENAA